MIVLIEDLIVISLTLISDNARMIMEIEKTFLYFSKRKAEQK